MEGKVKLTEEMLNVCRQVEKEKRSQGDEFENKDVRLLRVEMGRSIVNVGRFIFVRCAAEIFGKQNR